MVLLGACSPSANTAPIDLSATAVETQISEPFRIVGYVTQAIVFEAIPFDQVTHLNYAFLIPNEDGTFATLPNAWKLEKIVETAHEKDVEVLISVGGWGWDAEFETMAATPETRAVFVRELTKFVDEFQLDGADIDWEYPDPGESAQNFLRLIQELRVAMPDKLITTAVVSQGATGAGVLPETFEIFDFVNIMAYDGGEPHSPIGLAEEFFDYWLARGLPTEKAVLGVPFYAHPTYVPYRKIIEQNPQAAFLDEVEYYGALHNYNGIPTIQEKTRLALQRGSGVMIWTLEHDSQNDFSLVLAINQALQQSE